MTRQTVCFNLLAFLVVLLFPLVIFGSAKNENCKAEACIGEEVNISIHEGDFIPPGQSLESLNPIRGQKEKVGVPFRLDISEDRTLNKIQKLLEVNGIDNIIRNDLPGVPFIWEWMSLNFSSYLGDELVVDFKTAGIYIYDEGKWTSIYNGGIDPVSIVSINHGLAVNFGPNNGIYVYDGGNWTRIYNGVEAEKMVGFIDKLVVDFGISYGIYEYNSRTNEWTNIYSSEKTLRDSMIGLGDKLVVDFKTDGIFIYDDGIWKNIYNGGIDPVSMVSFDGKLAVDFGPGYGIYVYEYETNNWKRIYTGVAVEKMAGFDKYLAVDFGTAYGLYVYEYDNDIWTRIYKGGVIEKMAGFSNKLAIDFGINYGIYEYTFTTNTWNKIYHASIPRDDMCASDVFD